MSVNAAELIVLTKAVGALDAQLALEAVGAAVVAAGVESVKMAGDFQSSVTKLYTTAGEAHSNLKMVSDGILNMSASVGTGAQQLVQAMYWVESGGLHGAKALEALRVAAQAAKAENADLDKVSIALAASLNAYAGSGMSAVQVMNTLTAATGQGMMTFEQLSGSLASVLPAAAKFGISLNNVTAALATMTAQGDPAEQAATHLKQVILALEAPSKIGAASLKLVGLTSTEVANEMRKNLPDALKMITDAVGKKFPEGSAAYNQAIKNIAGGSKQMMGFLELTGTHMSTFADNVGKISSAVQKGGNDLMGWSDIQQNFNFKMDAATAAVGVLAIKVGTALLPSLGQLLDKVTPLIQNFSDWVTQNHVVENSIAAVGTAITTTVGFIQNLIAIGTSVVQFFQQNEVAAAALGVAIGALGGVLALFAASSVADMILSLLDYGLSMLTAASETVTAATVMTSTFAEMSGMIIASMGTTATAILSTLGPFLLVGAVVAAVGIGIVLAIQHWGEISQWFSGVWAGVVSGFNSAVGGMNYAIQATIQWFITWQQPIIAVTTLITAFFLPALIQAGVQALISGGAIAGPFVGGLVMSGLAAANSAILITADFINAMLETGTAAVINGAKVTYSFVASMIAAGWEAVVAGAKITYSFIASLIATGVAGWVAAGGLVPFIGGLIASAYQSLIAAGAMMTSVVPALYAVGVAAYAALGPIGLVLGAIALTVTAFALMKQKSDEMQLGVSGAFDTMGNKVERSTGRIMVSADQMKTNVSNSTKTMSQNVSDNMLNAMTASVADSQSMSTRASALWNQFNHNATASLQSLDSSTISYMNSIANYIENGSRTAAMIANENFASIHVPSMSGSNVTHNFNDSSNLPGHASGIYNNPVGHWAMVGEQGPEPMYIPKGASIIPNSQINGMGGSGTSTPSSGSKQPVIINLNVNGQLFARQLLPDLAHAIQYGTGITL